ncbi:hypothetical protein [Sphingobacterium multivorum]|uniref:Lipoprotein n=1 Tax=Sphingobacterium multivorum TaxID=28454 RepID=A0A2X2JE83_SPHMU|nr:hypothetical protein [Sphingobacterium multivorum]QRQ60086.1 hypothetical protein I6J33_18305 [Sphingobacterium multivorum]SPZ92034.1 Uncharacterised protein [Sphingobacterium multivorum]
MNLKTFFLYIPLCLGLVSCHQAKTPTPTSTKSEDQKKEQVALPASASLPSDTSSYDSPRFEGRVKEQAQQLMEMNDAGLFDKLHQKLTTTLPADQKDYFLRHPTLAVLAITKGNIFENGADDLGYIVYNKDNHRIEIILLDRKNNTFNTLYKELKVVNTLQNSDCSSSFGSLDYLVASELIYQEDYIRLNNSNYLIDDNSFEVTDISTNKNFDLQQGCLNKNIAKDAMANSLCVPTSSVYANFQCLKYNKKKQIFEIYFSQEFAD